MKRWSVQVSSYSQKIDFYIIKFKGDKWRCQLTVHLCGFSPVCLLMCTTSMYCALNGFSSLLQSFQRQTKAFLLLPIWSLLRCCKTEQVPKCHITIKNRGLKEIQIVKFMNKVKASLKISKTHDWNVAFDIFCYVVIIWHCCQLLNLQ